MCPEITGNVFVEEINCCYNLRYSKVFRTSLVKSAYHGTKTIIYLGPSIWDVVPDDFKKKPSLKNFKELIRKWIQINCLCRLCKV